MHRGATLRWPLDKILSGLEEGLRKAAAAAPEGIASIAVDGWSVDYVRLAPDGQPLREPFCYRDERTELRPRRTADEIIPPRRAFRAHRRAAACASTRSISCWPTGAQASMPMRHGLMMPEYVLYWLGGRRVAEYTNASHTGLVI